MCACVFVCFVCGVHMCLSGGGVCSFGCLVVVIVCLCLCVVSWCDSVCSVVMCFVLCVLCGCV